MLLMIHCRRGLFQLTLCQKCGHKFECQNCTANLVTYRKKTGIMELLCHQCQTSYNYPDKCPSCSSTQVISKYNGLDGTEEEIRTNFKLETVRLDKLSNDKLLNFFQNLPKTKTVCLTTRLFDPLIDYKQFDKIIFLSAENLLASPDYLVQEDTYKQIADLLMSVDREKTEISFETKNIESDFFNGLLNLSQSSEQNAIKNWYENFLEKELQVRQIFKLPPFWNLLLLTTQEKTNQIAQKKLEEVYKYLETLKSEFPEISYSKPYQAKFLKRKGKFSYHLLIKFPRQYEKFFKLRKDIFSLGSTHNLQIRLNPRHLF
jgi:primosomal protein N' (replication factor Y) (superfamily II helicase)